MYYKDALKKYKDMTVEEMVSLLCGEVGDKVGKEIDNCTMFRIYHSLQVIWDKIREEDDN